MTISQRHGLSLSLTWYGQAGFRLAGGDSQVLIDPFMSERDTRRYPPVASAEDFGDITLVLCTHEHLDHMDTGFLPKFAAANRDARIVVPAPVLDQAVNAGLDAGRLVGAVPGEKLTDRDVTVHPLPALHGIGGGKPVVYEFGDGRFLGYLIDVAGVRVFHTGDALVYSDLVPALLELAPDVLLVPINGRDHMREKAGVVGNMNETEAAWLATEVNPAYVIPMHYEMFTGNRGDVGRFTSLVHERAADGGPAVLIPPRGRPVSLAVP
jgi:L-ascorbate 6-phosphate lactonase